MNELKALKKQLENNINSFVLSEIEKFKAETELEVSSIELFFNEVTAVSDNEKRFWLSHVQANIEV
jgi:hypothetical protein